MNTSFERSANASDEWYTPREIIEALGEFDLDPCAPMHPLWPTAKIMYNKQDNGLVQNWGGRIWLNPPYSKPLIWHYLYPFYSVIINFMCILEIIFSSSFNL